MTDGVSQQGFWKKNTTSTDAVQKWWECGDCFSKTRYDLAGSNRPSISLLWQRPNDIRQSKKQMEVLNKSFGQAMNIFLGMELKTLSQCGI